MNNEQTATLPVDQLRALLAKPEIVQVEGVPYAVLPQGFKLESLAALLPVPLRTRRKIAAHDLRGLIAYANRFKDPRTALYCGPEAHPAIEARLDDHQPGAPANAEHTCHFACPTTTEWNSWNSGNRKQMGQPEFAEFIENNLRDIVEPADMLSLVINFRDHGSAEFQSAIRLQSGRMQFRFIEKQEAGEVQFPEVMKVAVPVFQGLPQRYATAAKLRYRIKEGVLTLWYELDRPDLVLRTAYNDLIEHVEKEVGLPVCRAL